MANPWLTIIGLGEDGLEGLTGASLAALDAADLVFGAPRHLELARIGDKGRAWPIPFSLEPVLALRGRRIAILASGDPFWHGAGGSIVGHLDAGEWRSFPAPSTLSLAASALGWRLEDVICLALHAEPFEQLVPLIAPGGNLIVTLRDGAAVRDLATWLTSKGFGASNLWVMEALGGPRERIRETPASLCTFTDIAHPVTVGIQALGARALPRASGLPNDLFAHDGQITKQPVRALTLSALTPRPGEHLWDLGAGSGSISVEFCLSAPGTTASAVEARPARAENIKRNAAEFGLDHRITLFEGKSLDVLSDLPDPDVIFIGGGASQDLIHALWDIMTPGTSLVVNAVTLETETLLTRWHAEKGGHLLRVELSEAAPLGTMRGWERARPVIQWSITK